MNYNGSKNQSYSHFPWLEEKLKEYELNILTTLISSLLVIKRHQKKHGSKR